MNEPLIPALPVRCGKDPLSFSLSSMPGACGVWPIDELCALEARCFTDPWSKNAFAASAAQEQTHLFLLRDRAGCLVGFAMLLALPPEAEVMNLAVDPALQGRGLGRRLLEALLACGRRLGVSDFYLEVRESNAAARALYARLGFRFCGRRRRYYQHPAEDALLMHLSCAAEAMQEIRAPADPGDPDPILTETDGTKDRLC